MTRVKPPESDVHIPGDGVLIVNGNDVELQNLDRQRYAVCIDCHALLNQS